MASKITATDEFARWLEEWLRKISKGDVFDTPLDRPAGAVIQHSSRQTPRTREQESPDANLHSSLREWLRRSRN